METTTNNAAHKFELAGLGKAPFRVLAVEQRRGPIRWTDPATGVEMQAGAEGQPMGTCAYCGTGIAECWIIGSADGREFIVGCDCVSKTDDAGLVKEISKHAKAKRADAKAREEARIDAVRVAVTTPEVRAALEAQPHPNAFRAAKGDTRAHWAAWMLTNAGHSGRMQVVRFVDRLRKEGAK